MHHKRGWQLIKTHLLMIAALVFAGEVVAQQQYSAGFASIDSAGLWYPSTDQETLRRGRSFNTRQAWEGKGASGLFPVILISHGINGRYRNHRDTAAALARAGFIVIAPQHTQDKWIGTDQTVAAIEYRFTELAKSLAAARRHHIVGELMDVTKMGAIGYSLGALTVLGADGILPSQSLFKRHCDKHSAEDPNFCMEIPWWRKALQWFSEPTLSDKKEFSPVIPIGFQSIALVAPVGAIFPAHQFRDLSAKVAIYRLGQDNQVSYPFHADYIFKSLDQNAARYKVYDDVHHYAFISPFPDWLLEEEYIPVSIDPAGFDREAFLEVINADIVEFFNDSLGD